VTAPWPAPAWTMPQETVGQANRRPGADGGGEADTTGAGRRASLTEQGYVHASFGGVPVLVGPQLAAQLKALRQKQP
jgi:hypothetical protein